MTHVARRLAVLRAACNPKGGNRSLPGVRGKPVQRTLREQIVPWSKLGGEAVAVLFPDFWAAMQQLRPKAAMSTRPDFFRY